MLLFRAFIGTMYTVISIFQLLSVHISILKTSIVSFNIILPSTHMNSSVFHIHTLLNEHTCSYEHTGYVYDCKILSLTMDYETYFHKHLFLTPHVFIA